jgi:hypothetical protein
MKSKIPKNAIFFPSSFDWEEAKTIAPNIIAYFINNKSFNVPKLLIEQGITKDKYEKELKAIKDYLNPNN